MGGGKVALERASHVEEKDFRTGPPSPVSTLQLSAVSTPVSPLRYCRFIYYSLKMKGLQHQLTLESIPI